MTFNSTQTTELSLDQLDNVSAGFASALIRGVKAVKTLRKAATGKNVGRASFAGLSAHYIYKKGASFAQEIKPSITSASEKLAQKITGSFSSLFSRRS